MITYKVMTAFTPEWPNVFKSLFPEKEHDASLTNPGEAYFSFTDETVTPADLGPLVRVERVDSIPFHNL